MSRAWKFAHRSRCIVTTTPPTILLGISDSFDRSRRDAQRTSRFDFFDPNTMHDDACTNFIRCVVLLIFDRVPNRIFTRKSKNITASHDRMCRSYISLRVLIGIWYISPIYAPRCGRVIHNSISSMYQRSVEFNEICVDDSMFVACARDISLKYVVWYALYAYEVILYVSYCILYEGILSII